MVWSDSLGEGAEEQYATNGNADDLELEEMKRKWGCLSVKVEECWYNGEEEARVLARREFMLILNHTTHPSVHFSSRPRMT